MRGDEKQSRGLFSYARLDERLIGESDSIYGRHNGCLSEMDSEFEQLTMDSWSTLQRICDAYLPDEVPDFQMHRRPPCRCLYFSLNRSERVVLSDR